LGAPDSIVYGLQEEAVLIMKPLFIGMPVYNSERFIAQALESLIKQTFKDWVLLISDNASSDTTPAICQSYSRKDSRIQYIRQFTNIGAINNFRYLLGMAKTEFFMWAASDDEWESEFIEACLYGLEDPEFDWAFTNIINIDTFGHVTRAYPSFRFLSTGEDYLRIANFVLAPEIYGKANLIYGIYRLPKLRERLYELLTTSDVNIVGYDMVINLAVLCQANLFIDERALFRKRHINMSDIADKPKEIQITLPFVSGTMRKDFIPYKEAIRRACSGTKYAKLIELLMETRANYQDEITALETNYQELSKGYENLYKEYQDTLAELEFQKNASILRKVFRFIKSNYLRR
jgi:glycosyltransferase involved in cell wall biosynthesis